MKKKTFSLILALILLLNMPVVFSANQTPLGDTEILVREGDDVQQKIDSANENDTLVFDIGTYTLNLLVDKNVNFRGISTSHVILKGNGSNPIFEINRATTTIQNFSFMKDGVESSAEPSIGVLSIGGTVKIRNNIFDLNSAIQLDNASDVNIKNNVFFNVNSAVKVFDFTREVVIKNNIFSNENVPNSLLVNVVDGFISSNCFDFTSGLSNLPLSKSDGDLGFVDIDNKDFHLTVSSICKDDSDLSVDMGAYGGADADEYAFPVSDLSVVAGTTPTSATVSWQSNDDYRVDGYKIYYGVSPFTDFDFRTSRGDLTSKTVSADITKLEVTGLLESIDKPAVPTSVSVSPESTGKLRVAWEKVSGATNYTVYYREANAPASIVATPIVAADTDNYTLTDLVDGISYTVWVVANSQYQYYFQVTPYIDTVVDNEDVAVEGLFLNADTQYIRADKNKVSDKSISVEAFPESVEPYPALPNEGCFIATAAFGYYSHAQVQTLRDFRDHFLLTNEYGTAFVRWYYSTGPYVAEIINDYTFLKPIVRVALYPLIISAQLMAYSLILFWGLLLVSLLFLTVLIIRITQFTKQSCNGARSDYGYGNKRLSR